nr:SUMF1/EgtB/PvdO family nonheme iron enzyme [Bacteroidota bacterium]
MKLKLIPAGSFIMGGTEENEIPVHRVIITKPFYIGVYEVTRDQYNTIMDSKIPEYENSKIPAGITWNEAVEFCKKLSELTGNTYRLPTEAEWEYAARGGLESKKYVWGNNETPV